MTQDCRDNVIIMTDQTCDLTMQRDNLIGVATFVNTTSPRRSAPNLSCMIFMSAGQARQIT